MSLHDDFLRATARIEELMERVRRLERLNPLENTSIDSGPGLAVKTPEGINVKPGASIDAGDLKIGNASGVGSLKAGPSEVSKDGVGSGGTKIGNTGKIGSTHATIESEKPFHAPGLKSLGGINADGGIIAEEYIQGRTAVFTPWQGGVASVEGIAGGIKSTAQSAASTASTANSRANAAMNVANSSIDYGMALDAKIENQIDALWDRIESGSGGKIGYPITPPPPKG